MFPGVLLLHCPPHCAPLLHVLLPPALPSGGTGTWEPPSLPLCRLEEARVESHRARSKCLGKVLVPLVPFNCTGCGLVADGRGVGLPLSPGQLSNLHSEVPDRGGPIAAWDPLEPEAAGCHFCLGHQELSGGCRPLCKQRRTDQGGCSLLFSAACSDSVHQAPKGLSSSAGVRRLSYS